MEGDKGDRGKGYGCKVIGVRDMSVRGKGYECKVEGDRV